ARLQRALEETGALAALLLRHPSGQETYTKVYFDGTQVTGFGEGEGEALMFSGSHAISDRIFEYLPPRPFSGLTEDLYRPLLRDRHEKLAGTVDDGLWYDIGTPRRYMAATDEMRNRMLAGDVAMPDGSNASSRSIVDATAAIRGVVEESVIGAESTIDRGGRVLRSAVWKACRVEGDVEESILCDGVQIPDRASVRNALVCRRRDDLEALPGLVLSGELAAVPADAEKLFRFVVA
ncbi:MAG TPA: NDP-sugar synthase, partial [Thermoanaerobaculia bacterium]